MEKGRRIQIERALENTREILYTNTTKEKELPIRDLAEMTNTTSAEILRQTSPNSSWVLATIKSALGAKLPPRG
jgi:hypothetical protein